MRSAPTDESLLVDIDRSLKSGPWHLAFPAPLEARFEADTGARRCRWLFTSTLVGLAFYLLSLRRDAHLLPDVFQSALDLKLGAILPFFLLSLLVYTQQPPPWLREATASAVGIAIMIVHVYLLHLSKSPFLSYAYHSPIIEIVFANLVVRSRFWYALSTSIAFLALFTASISLHDAFHVEIKTNAVITLAITAAATLYANFNLERDSRRAYLIGLRERLRARILRRSNRALSRLSTLDPLTGLTNRRGLDERLSAMIQAALASRQPLAVLMVDIDNFKQLNDRCGHPAGDACLKHVAEVIGAEVRNGAELVARYGGEEFLVALPGADLVDGMQIAERLRHAVESRVTPVCPGPSRPVTLSIGVAALPEGAALSAGRIVEAADVALYEAKRRGRNRVWPPVRTPGTPGQQDKQAAGIAEVA